MTITNLMNRKIISIIIFSCGLLSCNVSKNDNLVKNQIQVCLDDFISNYSTFETNDIDTLVSVLIQKKDGYIVMDTPKEFVLGSLNDINSDKLEYKIRTYKGIFCIYNKSEFSSNLTFLKKVSKSIKEEAKTDSKFTFPSGKEIKIDYTNLNWEPQVKVFYDFKNKKKKIETLSSSEPIFLPWN